MNYDAWLEEPYHRAYEDLASCQRCGAVVPFDKLDADERCQRCDDEDRRRAARTREAFATGLALGRALDRLRAR